VELRAALAAGERALSESARLRGGWSLEAAEAIGAAAVGSENDVAELLNQLVRKSMVVADEVRGAGPFSTRYRFLETLRQHAEEKLVFCAEAEAVRTRDADWLVGDSLRVRRATAAPSSIARAGGLRGSGCG
jgi:predicted ATPase